MSPSCRPSPVVRAESLAKSFVGPPRVTALHSATFDIWPGEFVAVTGPSGSGKSTLLSLLGLLDAPTAGRLAVDGIDTADLSDGDRAGLRAARLGFVFQAFHLVGYRTVRDNVELGLLYRGVRRRDRRAATDAVLDRLGLQHRAAALCAHLSGGEQQRVAIARTLVAQPSLALCDEPTGNLDSGNTAAVLETLHHLNAGGLTIVVVTHDPAVASQAGRCLELFDGRLCER